MTHSTRPGSGAAPLRLTDDDWQRLLDTPERVRTLLVQGLEHRIRAVAYAFGHEAVQALLHTPDRELTYEVNQFAKDLSWSHTGLPYDAFYEFFIQEARHAVRVEERRRRADHTLPPGRTITLAAGYGDGGYYLARVAFGPVVAG